MFCRCTPHTGSSGDRSGRTPHVLVSGTAGGVAARGMTLIDVIVGTSIMLVVFLGLFGAFKLSVELVYSTKAKTGAVSLLTERMEYLRGLPYASVGTIGGIPSGNVPQVEQMDLNGITYTVRTLIQYVDDPADGLDENDENGITADYKTAKVEVSWSVRGSGRSTFAVTSFTPVGEETLADGGTLRVNVFDNNVHPVSGATVHIVNATVNPAIDVSSETNTSGVVSFPGTPTGSSYEIYVTKNGYSSAQTYGATSENPSPSPIHVSVFDAQTTTVSLSIDVNAALRIFTYSPAGPGSFDDSFTSGAGLSNMASVSVTGGALVLSGDPDTGYAANGNAFSNAFAPLYLSSWDEITYTSNVPTHTGLIVRLFYFNGSVYTLVPDDDLAGNSLGFTSGSIDISNLDTSTYGTLQLGAFLTTADSSATPELLDWHLAYVAGPTPLPNVSLAIHGAKTIGSDADGLAVYKYDDSFTTNQYGEWLIDPIEWDSYTLALPSEGDYDVVERCPNTVAPAPGETVDVAMTLGSNTARSLRIAVTGESNEPLDGVTVTLTGPVNKSATTDACGQTYFGNLAQAIYTLTIQKSGYQAHTEDVGITKETEYAISLLAN